MSGTAADYFRDRRRLYPAGLPPSAMQLSPAPHRWLGPWVRIAADKNRRGKGRGGPYCRLRVFLSACRKACLALRTLDHSEKLTWEEPNPREPVSTRARRSALIE